MTTRLTLYTREDRAKAVEAVRRAGQRYVIEIKPPTRSLEQSSRMWAMLDEISVSVMWDGERLTSEEWKWVFTAALKRQKIVRGIDGGLVAIGSHTSTLTIEDMGDLMELMTEFGVTRGVQFKFPEDQYTDKLPGGDSGSEAGARDGKAGDRAPAEVQGSKA